MSAVVSRIRLNRAKLTAMPLLNIKTNVEYPEDKRDELLREFSTSLAGLLGKPEGYVMVSLEINPHMLFAGEDKPLAYLELKSIGLPHDRTPAFSDTLCGLIFDHLEIAPERVYIEFTDAARHLWGWNGRTF